MANHQQAAKRNRQRIKIQAHHRHFRTTMRSQIKRVRVALEAGDSEKAKDALGLAIPLVDRCAQKNVLPRKRASRIIGRLTRAVNNVAVTPAE